ncbi:phage holin [Shouchella hunanensis]|uniref:Phage holin n=1 Tax=Shouchella hunanensis TaxID=766894 RepID=A0ABY7W8F4_9BACI|nr:phage holin [Shouchella hunanensis]WDF02970.1 phage holin [Shouchella hunanensis]
MDKGTVVRTIAMIIVWINVFLTQQGLMPIPVLDEGMIAAGLALVVSIWTWFKNNYITLKGRKQKQELVKAGLAKGDK